MLGLALEGGGAKGAFHMGAVKAFLEEGYEFNGITGTSIGAINGAIIAQGDFETGYKIWENMNTSMLFDIEHMQMEKILNRHFDKEAFAYLTSKIKDVIENKGLDTSKIRGILSELIDEDKLRRSKIDFGLVTVSVPDLEPLEIYKEDIPYGKMLDYIMASANVPIFKIEPIEGRFYIDGGFHDNCPVNLLCRKGYKDIIAVRTLGIGKIRKLEDKSVNVKTLIPSENLGRVLDFDNSIIQTNLKMGYFDALRMLKGLAGQKYYLRPVAGDKIMGCFFSVPESKIDRLRVIMGLPKTDPMRLFFEHILPGLSKLLGLPKSAAYQDILMGVLEFAAAQRGLERYRIRDLSEFIEEIKMTSPEEKNADDPLLSNIAKKTKKIISQKAALIAVTEELLDILTPEQFV